VSPLIPSVPDRDIDFVLITGAGASRAFGVNQTQLPLMDDWSEALVKRLRETGPGFLEATQLRDGMPAEEFEARLGQFLRSVAGFEEAAPLLGPLAKMRSSHQPPMGEDGWTNWHQQGSWLLAEVTQVIYESLYEMFGAPNFDPALPQQAYGALFRALSLTPPDHPAARWVYATTNYDRIGELAIHLNGGIPDTGEIAFDPAVSERPLRVENLLGGIPRHVPVLHLHGQVGWFIREGRPLSLTVTRYDRNLGTPIIMLPDLEKTYDNVGIITTLWQQFEEALSRARRVLIVGHSLHDKALIRALHANLDRLDRVAVTYLQSERSPNQAESEEAEGVRERVERELSGAYPVLMRFAAGIDPLTTDLREWLGKGVGS
jgi:hypothetical protein